ncbi:uncharacterized protein TM35_000531330 [Trypanosoma theileri]|uniref:Uncharacterized protein n=1 Tax=Trypanosoma theileri TaxID=67003 RepID=A0A1X0NIE2_9TRYP|nr:uncharacterized protein TM35_000531330 [Trypanosoma theileri]ORC83949.1 hypothetical protein TM35_000531330 [Trypanosoma theileri]
MVHSPQNLQLQQIQIQEILRTTTTVQQDNLNLLRAPKNRVVQLRILMVLRNLQRVIQQTRLKVQPVMMRNQPPPPQQQHFLLNSQTTRRVMQTAAAVSAVLCGCVYHY